MWDAYAKYKVSPAEPATLRHADVEQLLTKLESLREGAIELRTLGRSVEGRPIRLVRVGTGPRRVLLWSQMHGDEPTHTAVLLDLLALLQSNPDHETAKEILAGCTLWMIPMLNPDGADRWTRQNAQGIDVNRDARALATPEGRVLQAAVEQFQPEFAFNLHNQNRRSRPGGGSEPAAVSLIVPPPDQANTQNDATHRARQVAAALLEAIGNRCPGAISRYRADYMPRAFGESLQRQGVSTVLVEAGSWRGHDAADLVRLHSVGLIAALRSIAAGSYQQTDTRPYHNLPFSDEQRLFDMVVGGATILSGGDPQPFRADLGINTEDSRPGSQGPPTSGKIIEIGDLQETGGIDTIRGQFVCLPGRIEFDPQLAPCSPPDRERQRQALLAGVTTLIGQIDLARPEETAAFVSLRRAELAIHVGFVGRWSPTAGQTGGDREMPARNWAQAAHATAAKLQLFDRGRIALDHLADLVVFDKPAAWTPDTIMSAGRVRHVVVNGRLAVDDRRPVCTTAGQLITPSMTSPENSAQMEPPT